MVLLLVQAFLLLGLGDAYGLQDGRKFKWGEPVSGTVGGFPIVYEEDFEDYVPGSLTQSSSPDAKGYLPQDLFPQKVLNYTSAGTAPTWTLNNGGRGLSSTGTPSAAYQGYNNLVLYVRANNVSKQIAFPGVSLAGVKAPWLEFRYASARINGVNTLAVHWGVLNSSHELEVCGEDPFYYLDALMTEWTLQTIDLSKVKKTGPNGEDYGVTPDGKSLADLIESNDTRKIFFVFIGTSMAGAGTCMDQVRIVDRQTSEMKVGVLTPSFVKEPVGIGTQKNPAILLGVDVQPGKGRVELKGVNVEVEENKQYVTGLSLYATRSPSMSDAVADPRQLVCKLNYDPSSGKVTGVKEWSEDWKPTDEQSPKKPAKKSLRAGGNYFWLVADISDDANGLKEVIRFKLPQGAVQLKEYSTDLTIEGTDVSRPDQPVGGGLNGLQIYDVLVYEGFESTPKYEWNLDAVNVGTSNPLWLMGKLDPASVTSYVSSYTEKQQLQQLPEDVRIFQHLESYMGDGVMGTGIATPAAGSLGGFTPVAGTVYPHIFKAPKATSAAERAKGRTFIKQHFDFSHYKDVRVKYFINANIDGFNDFSFDYVRQKSDATSDPSVKDWKSLDKIGAWRNVSSQGWQRQMYDISRFATRQPRMWFGFEMVCRGAYNSEETGVYLDELQVLAYPLHRDINVTSLKVKTEGFNYGEDAQVVVEFSNSGSKTIEKEVVFDFFANGRKIDESTVSPKTVETWDGSQWVARAGGLQNIASREKVRITYEGLLPEPQKGFDNLVNLEVRGKIKEPNPNEDDDDKTNNSRKTVFYNYPTFAVSRATPYPTFDEKLGKVVYEKLHDRMMQWFPSSTNGKNNYCSWRQVTPASFSGGKDGAPFTNLRYGSYVWTTGREGYAPQEESVLTGPVLEVETGQVMELVLDYAMSGGEMWVEYSYGDYDANGQVWKRVDASWTGASPLKLWYGQGTGEEDLENSWAFVHKTNRLTSAGPPPVYEPIPEAIPEKVLAEEYVRLGSPAATYDGKYQLYNYARYLQSKFILPDVGKKKMQFRVHFRVVTTEGQINDEAAPRMGVAINQIQVRGVRPDFRIIGMGPNFACGTDIAQGTELTAKIMNVGKYADAAPVNALLNLKVYKLSGYEAVAGQDYGEDQVASQRDERADLQIPALPIDGASGNLNLGLELPWQSMSSWGYKVVATIDASGAEGYEGYGDEEEANNEFTWYYYPYRLSDPLIKDWEPVGYPDNPRKFTWIVADMAAANGSFDVSDGMYTLKDPLANKGSFTVAPSTVNGEVNASAASIGDVVDYTYTLVSKRPKWEYDLATGKVTYSLNEECKIQSDKVTIKKGSDAVSVSLVSPSVEDGSMICDTPEGKTFKFSVKANRLAGANPRLVVIVNGKESTPLPLTISQGETKEVDVPIDGFTGGYNDLVVLVRTDDGNVGYSQNALHLKDLYLPPKNLDQMPIFVRGLGGVVSKVKGKRYDAGAKKWVYEPNIMMVEKWGPVDNYTAESKWLEGLNRPFMEYRWKYLENGLADWNAAIYFPDGTGGTPEYLEKPELELGIGGGQYKLVMHAKAAPGGNSCEQPDVESKPIEVQNIDLQVLGFTGVRNGYFCHSGEKDAAGEWDLDVPSGLKVELTNYSPAPLPEDTKIRFSVWIDGVKTVTDYDAPLESNVAANERFSLSLPESIKASSFSATLSHTCKVVVTDLVYPDDNNPDGRAVADGNQDNNTTEQGLKLEFPPEIEILPTADNALYKKKWLVGESASLKAKVAGGNSVRWEYSSDFGKNWTKIDNGEKIPGPSDVPHSSTEVSSNGIDVKVISAPWDGYRAHVVSDGSGCSNKASVFFNMTDIAVTAIMQPSLAICGKDAVEGTVVCEVANLGYGKIPVGQEYVLTVVASDTNPDPDADPNKIMKSATFTLGNTLYPKDMAINGGYDYSTVWTIRDFPELADLIKNSSSKSVFLKASVSQIDPPSCMADIDESNNSIKATAAWVLAPRVLLKLNSTDQSIKEALDKPLGPGGVFKNVQYQYDGADIPVSAWVTNKGKMSLTSQQSLQYSWEYVSSGLAEDVNAQISGDAVVLPVVGNANVDLLSWKYENANQTPPAGAKGRGSGVYRVQVSNRGCMGAASLEIKFNFSDLAMAYPEDPGYLSPLLNNVPVVPEVVAGPPKEVKPIAAASAPGQCALGEQSIKLRMVNTGNKTLESDKDRKYTIAYGLKIGDYDSSENDVASSTAKAWYDGPEKKALHAEVLKALKAWPQEGSLPAGFILSPGGVAEIPEIIADFGFLAPYRNARDLDIELKVTVSFANDRQAANNSFTFKLTDFADANMSIGTKVHAVIDNAANTVKNKWTESGTGSFRVYRVENGEKVIPKFVHEVGVPVGFAFNNYKNNEGGFMELQPTPGLNDPEWILDGNVEKSSTSLDDKFPVEWSNINDEGTSNFARAVFTGFGRICYVGKTANGCSDKAYVDLIGEGVDFVISVAGTPQVARCEGDDFAGFNLPVSMMNASTTKYTPTTGNKYKEDWVFVNYKVEGPAGMNFTDEPQKMEDLLSGGEMEGGNVLKLRDLSIGSEHFQMPGTYKVTVELVIKHGELSDLKPNSSQGSIDGIKQNNKFSFDFEVHPRPVLPMDLPKAVFYTQERKLFVPETGYNRDDFNGFQWYLPSTSAEPADWQTISTDPENSETKADFSESGTYHVIFNDRNTGCASNPWPKEVEFKAYLDLKPASITAPVSKCDQKDNQAIKFSIYNPTDIALEAGPNKLDLKFEVKKVSDGTVVGTVTKNVSYPALAPGESTELTVDEAVSGLNKASGAYVIEVTIDEDPVTLAIGKTNDKREALKSKPIENYAPLKAPVLNAQ
ncbi:MAG: hypothetical protein CSA97_01005, partial [Bacteroidetes bacterium]